MTPDEPIVQSDLDALLELLDRATLREIIAIFAASCPMRLGTVRAGLLAGDLPAVATAYHTMRSGCGQLGARTLEDMCARAEREAKAGVIAGSAIHLERVEEEVARVLTWFSAKGWMDA